MRIIIIGGSHAGTSAAGYLKQLKPTDEVILINENNKLGFIPSSINFIFEGSMSDETIHTKDFTKKETLEELGISVLLDCQVTTILPAEKKILYSTSNKIKHLSYDYLILAMGSAKFYLPETNKTAEDLKLLTYKSPSETASAYDKLANSQNIAIIGAGLIGLELASSLALLQNKEITIFEQMSRPLFRYFDEEITQILLEHKPDCLTFVFNKTFYQSKKKGKGIKLSFFDNTTKTSDVAVLAINPKPNIAIVPSTVAVDFDKTINTNAYMQTTDPYIYAIGDLVKVPFSSAINKAYIPLISIARKTALIAASHIAGIPNIAIKPMERTIATKIFDYYLGSTGITATEAALQDFTIHTVTKNFQHYSDLPEYANFTLTIKIIFDKKSHLLLGAQLITNFREVLELINFFAQAVADQRKLEELLFHEQFYVPKLSADCDFVTETILVALQSIR